MSRNDMLDEAKQMRRLTYMNLVDSVKGLEAAIKILRERIDRDGELANYSVDSDLLTWSQSVWKASNKVHSLDQIIESLNTFEEKGEVNDVSTNVSCSDSRRRRERRKGECRGANGLQPED